MEISVSELNELLQKEFNRGRQHPQINTPYVQIKDWIPDSNKDNVPEACKNCSNHPSNGGSGLCHCILGLTPVKCTTNETNCYSTGNGMTYTISKTTDNIK